MKTTSQKIAVFIIALLCVSFSFAQKKQVEKANKEFDKYSYIDAREIYLKVVEDGYDSAEILKKLGDTYYYNGDYDNASKWYTKLIDKYPTDTEAKYFYRAAQSLKSIDKYDESDKLMESYSAMGGEGLIVKNFQEDPEYLKTIAFKAKDYELEKVSVNTEYSDFGPSYFGDKLVFASNAKKSEGTKIYSWNELPFLDLYEADMDAEGKLSNVTPLNGDINTSYHESSTAFSKDGKTVYFTRNNFYKGKKGKDKNKTIRLKLYKATLSGDSFWTNIEELPFNDEEYSVAHPTLSVDGKRLYFSSDMPGTLGESDLWYVTISGDTYGTPVNLGPSINTEARETFPFISESNILYFSSDGRSGLGGLDIFRTPLDDNGKPQVVTNLGEPVNSKLDDFGFILKEEKKIGFLSSNRDGKGGSVADDIYRIYEKCEVTIKGVVTDKNTKQLLPQAEVILYDSANKIIERVIVGNDAAFSFNTLECEQEYRVTGTKQGYSPEEQLVKTPTTSVEVEVNLALTPDNPCPPNDLGCRLCLQPIFFDFDRFNIRPDAAVELAKILAAMRQYPQLVIHIESHTDSRATFSYNEVLSEKRAQSTLNWLVDHGIDRSRLSAKGYGEYQLLDRCIQFDECGREIGMYDCTQEQQSKPKCSDGVKCTEEEHQLNRRSMFIIQN